MQQAFVKISKCKSFLRRIEAGYGNSGLAKVNTEHKSAR
jgi:hypothetical protein